MEKRMVSLRAADFADDEEECPLDCSGRRLDEVKPRDATDMAKMTFEEAVYKFLPPERKDPMARISMRRKPGTLCYVVNDVVVQQFGSRAINHLVVRAIGRMFPDDRLKDHRAAVQDAMAGAADASEDAHLDLMATRKYALSSKVLPGANLKFGAWEPGVPTMLGAIAEQHLMWASTLLIIYMSIDLRHGGLKIGSTADKVFQREEENWYEWLDYDSKRLRRMW